MIQNCFNSVTNLCNAVKTLWLYVNMLNKRLMINDIKN